MKVEMGSEGSYKIDGESITRLGEVDGSMRVRKRPITILALRVEEGFTVETPEGVMTGKSGDWLMEGVNGEMYVCPSDVFAASYDVLEG